LNARVDRDYTLTEPVGPRGRSEPQILVALPGLARPAVMPAMSTKSRQVIYGGRVMGAKIRAQGAREEAKPEWRL
jgi:hypothetical protein